MAEETKAAAASGEKKATKCSHAKCKRAIRAKGYCRIHYKKWRRGELPKGRYTRCHKEGCKKPMGIKGLCDAPRSVGEAAAAAARAAAPAAESRQVALGADCVLRDPVRGDVLIAYLAKFSAAADRVSDVGRRRPTSTLPFAGAIVLPVERQIRHGHQVAVVTPREIQLIEVLAHAKDTVVSYDTLYSEVLQRRFGGDTSNMRVLLGKLAASAGHIGIPLRRWIEVIPKTGYRYRSAGGPNAKPASSAAA